MRAAIPSHNGIVLRVDSKLVQKQVSGVWACRSPLLWELREEVVALLEALERQRGGHQVDIEHAYREFNCEADGAANEAIDCNQRSWHVDGIVIFAGWF